MSPSHCSAFSLSPLRSGKRRASMAYPVHDPLLGRGELPMRRLPHWKRRLIALVATLLILSALLGDTDAGHAAATHAAVNTPHHKLSGCGWAVVSIGMESHAPAVRPLPLAIHRAEPGSGRALRSLVGVPPWVIWPPSPMPRIGGAVLDPPLTRSRVIASLLSTPDIWTVLDPAGLAPGRIGISPGWPEPFYPLDRLAGVDQRFPRPPPR